MAHRVCVSMGRPALARRSSRAGRNIAVPPARPITVTAARTPTSGQIQIATKPAATRAGPTARTVEIRSLRAIHRAVPIWTRSAMAFAARSSEANHWIRAPGSVS